MKSRDSIIERIHEVQRMINMAEHDKFSKSNVKVLRARYETLYWVLKDD